MSGKYDRAKRKTQADHWYDGPIDIDMLFASVNHNIPVVRKITGVETDPRYTQRKVWSEMMQEGPCKGLKSYQFEREFRQSQKPVVADV